MWPTVQLVHSPALLVVLMLPAAQSAQVRFCEVLGVLVTRLPAAQTVHAAQASLLLAVAAVVKVSPVQSAQVRFVAASGLLVARCPAAQDVQAVQAMALLAE
jgi:ABC-type Fe2+-enterobactin transport system substrate-binding protein